MVADLRTRRTATLPAAIAGVAGVATLVPFAARRRFRNLVTRDVGRLFSNPISSVGSEHVRARWDVIPEPIRRHLRFAIREGTPAIGTARLQHDGFFRTTPRQGWWPIEGEQYFTTAAPGFVWHATVRPLPGLWIEARDCLLDGRGHMLVKLESTFPLAAAAGPEIDQGASLRWLAESAWFPYALVGDAISWEPIDARSARATIRTGGLPVSAVFEVDPQGKLARLHASRYCDIAGGKAVLIPWTGRYGDYGEHAGFRIPASVEVSWALERGTFSYARFRITRVDYNALGRF